MYAPAPGSIPSPVAGSTGGTIAGVATLRNALGRLRTIVALALAVAVLVVVESYLGSIGVFDRIPGPGEPFNVTWVTGVQVGLGIAVGIAIGLMVIGILILAVLGAIDWRRGVLATTAASSELGPAHAASCQAARRDHSLTLWMFLVMLLAAIIVSVIFAGVNGTLSWLGVGTLPSTVGAVATSLATGAVLVLIYFYGTRHLVGLLSTVATPTEVALLGRGRWRMIGGAVVGLGTAFSAAFWGFNVFAVISLAVILPGVGNLCQAYDLWLAEHRPAPLPARVAGTAAA